MPVLAALRGDRDIGRSVLDLMSQRTAERDPGPWADGPDRGGELSGFDGVEDDVDPVRGRRRTIEFVAPPHEPDQRLVIYTVQAHSRTAQMLPFLASWHGISSPPSEIPASLPAPADQQRAGPDDT